MFREPPLKSLPSYLKLLSLIIIVISSFLVVLTIGLGISIPIFGEGILERVTLGGDFSQPETITAMKYFQIVNQLGVFIIPGVVFVTLTSEDFMGYLRLNDGWHRFSAFFGAVVIITSLPFVNWLLAINQGFHLPSFLDSIEDWMRNNEENAGRLTEAFLSTTSAKGFLVNLLMIAVIAAVGEELIFRGILVRLFHEWTKNVHVAVVLSAFLFSTLHLQFFGFLPRLALGLILGYSFIWSGSLWVPIIIHFVNNAAAVMISYLSALGVISTDLESIGASDHPLVIAGSFVVSAAILAFIFYHERVVRQGRVFK